MSKWYTQPGKEPEGLADIVGDIASTYGVPDLLGAFIHYLEDCGNELGGFDNGGDLLGELAVKLRKCLDDDSDFPEDDA